MRYYAFEYWSGRHTTTGEPNRYTGRMSTAGELRVFNTRKERDEWVDAGKVTSDMRGSCREAVTARKARFLCRGMALSEFNEMLEALSTAYD